MDEKIRGRWRVQGRFNLYNSWNFEFFVVWFLFVYDGRLGVLINFKYLFLLDNCVNFNNYSWLFVYNFWVLFFNFVLI